MEAAKVWPGNTVAVQTSRNALERSGFTLLEIMVVVTIVGLLATIATTNFMIARDNGRLKTIQHNLRKIEDAKEEWAADNRQADGAPVADMNILTDYFHNGTVRPVAQETYAPNPIGTPAEAALPAGVKLGPYGPGGTIPAP
jgi:prepilin-type N-terminal cleavage/methylation domain-containing protein